MDFQQHLAAITSSADLIASNAATAGLDAEVPTCPGWRVRDLVAHQGMVHRWATSLVVGDSEASQDPERFAEVGLAHDEPLVWLVEGAAALVGALVAAPDDLETMVFLKDAPPAREFWARRQCHETTIHAVDALSARESRMPSARDCGISAALAADGLDELLCGFLPRSRSRLRSDITKRIAVRPNDIDAAWLVTVSDEPPVTSRHTAESAELANAEVRFAGSAAELYLGLWNRGREVTTNDEDLLKRWRDLARVEW